MTILTVDDDPLLRTLVVTTLKDKGFIVLSADCAEQALSMFRDHSEDVDLLISDIQMPGIDGPSLAVALQSEKPDLQVLLISGSCNGNQLADGFDFMPKPFKLVDLLAKVRSLLDGQKHRPPLARLAVPKSAARTAAGSR